MQHVKHSGQFKYAKMIKMYQNRYLNFLFLKNFLFQTECPECGRYFKGIKGFRIHYGHMHKKK
jgi:hypothetical protein